MAAFSKGIKHLIDKYNGYNWIKVQSTSKGFLLQLQKLDQQIELIMEGPEPWELIPQAAELNLWGVIFKNEAVNKKQIEKAHSEGLYTVIFDVKTRAGTIKATNKHPDYIQTDNILLLQQCLRE
ncbi:MAG: hypothetical protein H0X62_02550 [Bacteroidetes bacterium]|nr:hypothetical protein [Bacteroidota bacterium]